MKKMLVKIICISKVIIGVYRMAYKDDEVLFTAFYDVKLFIEIVKNANLEFENRWKLYMED